MNILTRIVASLALVTTAFAHASCESPRRASDPKAPRRAMWVTRFDYLTVADVEKVVADCKLAGINTILFQVRGNATAFYKSSFEPWAEQFHFKDPGFDPLETAIRAAHANGIELHAWVNVMPAWWGTEKPTEPRQIYNTKPEWFWYDQKGERQPLAPKFYVSLNPCLPEVRKYLVDVLKDLAEHYAIDGLHLDYTRFPNDAVPGVAPRPGIDFPRDKTTLSLFAKDTGKTPDKDAAAWNAWRAEQVTSLVRDIRAMLRAARPKAELSSGRAGAGERARASLPRREDLAGGEARRLRLSDELHRRPQGVRRAQPALEGDRRRGARGDGRAARRRSGRRARRARQRRGRFPRLFGLCVQRALRFAQHRDRRAGCRGTREASRAAQAALAAAAGSGALEIVNSMPDPRWRGSDAAATMCA